MYFIKKYFELIFFIIAILFVLLGAVYIYFAYSSAEPVPIIQESQPYEVRFQSPFISEAWLVWGINGTDIAAAESQPAGTVIKDGLMHSPMHQQGDQYVLPINLPNGTQIRYGFLITYKNNSSTIELFEPNDFNHEVKKDNYTQTIAGTFPDNFFQPQEEATSQTIQYIFPYEEDATIEMVWGINDWQVTDGGFRE